MATVLKISEITKIKPSPDSPKFADESSLELTCFDIFWLKLAPVERLFFYQLDNATPSYFNSVILPNLKQSLAVTLLHYLPLAGNLKWPSNGQKPIVLYTKNDGVSLTVAESDADFDRLSSDGIFFEAVELHHLIPQLITSDDSASPMALQITLFPHKGFAIGITAHHAVLDGKTSTLFMKSWAHICKQGNFNENSPLPPELSPFLDRSIVEGPKGFDLGMFYLNQWLTRNGSISDISQIISNKNLKVSADKGKAPSLVRATFTITSEDVRKMRERVLSKSSDNDSLKQLRLSTFVLTLAYVSTCIVKARGGEGNRTVLIGFTADCRSRLDPPIPENYVGNCNTGFGVSLKARDIMDVEDGFAFATKMISDLVKGLIEKGVFEGAGNKLTPIIGWGKKLDAGSIQVISVAGSPRFDVYGSDFGWGKPCKVDVASIDRNEAISMAESRDGSKGVEVGLALNKHEMERFTSMFLREI